MKLKTLNIFFLFCFFTSQSAFCKESTTIGTQTDLNEPINTQNITYQIEELKKASARSFRISNQSKAESKNYACMATALGIPSLALVLIFGVSNTNPDSHRETISSEQTKKSGTNISSFATAGLGLAILIYLWAGWKTIKSYTNKNEQLRLEKEAIKLQNSILTSTLPS